jgi:hypothetical protein
MLSSWWNENWQGKLKYFEETCSNATSSIINYNRSLKVAVQGPVLWPTPYIHTYIINYTWPELGSNSGHNIEKPVTDHLSYGINLSEMFFVVFRRNRKGEMVRRRKRLEAYIHQTI